MSFHNHIQMEKDDIEFKEKRIKDSNKEGKSKDKSKDVKIKKDSKDYRLKDEPKSKKDPHTKRKYTKKSSLL